MKRTFLAALGIALAVPAAQAEGTLDKIRSSGAITLGVRDASIPFSFVDQNQAAVGYSIDLCMRVADAVKRELKMPNLEVKRQVVTSANRIPLIANGTVDIECGSTVNNLDRQKIVAFSDTTFLVYTKLVAKKASGIHSMQDLKGKTVAVTSGTNTMEKVTALNQKMNLGLTIIPGKDHAESFMLVETGRAAAFFEDDILLAGLAANSKAPNDYALVAIEGMDADPYALMIRRDDPAFKKLVDATVKQAFASGEIYGIYDKWFTKPIPPKGIVLNFPQSDAWKRVVAKPTDSGDPKDYR
ncbi:MAG: amino acid ABC transporter substrate-binding protein [Bacillota bacterium]